MARNSVKYKKEPFNIFAFISLNILDLVLINAWILHKAWQVNILGEKFTFKLRKEQHRNTYKVGKSHLMIREK